MIRDNRSIADFADFGDEIDPDWIARAEGEIGVPLPQSFKWWLLNYSGGEVGGEEIFSVYEKTSDDFVGGDIVYMYSLAIKKGRNPKLIPLCHSDVDGVFSFEIEDGLQGNEYPVISDGTGRRYADNFLDFLEKRIALFA